MTQRITDDEWKIIGDRVLAIPGMRIDNESDFIAEGTKPGYTYMKFMSDHGVTDDLNGTVFTDYMRLKGHTVESSRPRSMTVLDADMRSEFL